MLMVQNKVENVDCREAWACTSMTPKMPLPMVESGQTFNNHFLGPSEMAPQSVHCSAILAGLTGINKAVIDRSPRCCHLRSYFKHAK